MNGQISVKVARFGYETHEYTVAAGETVAQLLARPGWQNLAAGEEVRLNGKPVKTNAPVTGNATLTIAPKVNGG